MSASPASFSLQAESAVTETEVDGAASEDWEDIRSLGAASSVNDDAAGEEEEEAAFGKGVEPQHGAVAKKAEVAASTPSPLRRHLAAAAETAQLAAEIGDDLCVVGEIVETIGQDASSARSEAGQLARAIRDIAKRLSEVEYAVAKIQQDVFSIREERGAD